mgnify:CR=1 FL=1
MSTFVEIDGVFINKTKVAYVAKYHGTGYDRDLHTCIFFAGQEDDYLFVKIPIEKVMGLLDE